MIIGLEGVSCVGKTTLAAGLAGHIGHAAVVECYFHAAPDPALLPDPLAATPEAQLENLAMLMQIEALRAVKAREALAQGQVVILDRTVDTLLAHTHAIGRRFGFDCDQQARALVLAAPAAIPDITLLLQAGPQTLQHRAARRIGMPPIFYEPQFTVHFLEHFSDPVAHRCIALPQPGRHAGHSAAGGTADLLTDAVAALTTARAWEQIGELA